MHKTIVYMPGVWDMLHIGHVTILEKAKAVGDILIVGVPSDEVVKEDKGEYPIISCEHRVRMLQALKCVDIALPYYAFEFVTALRKVDANVLVVGETWGSAERHKNAEEYMKMTSGRIVQFDYTKEISTTKIKESVLFNASLSKATK